MERHRPCTCLFRDIWVPSTHVWRRAFPGIPNVAAVYCEYARAVLLIEPHPTLEWRGRAHIDGAGLPPGARNRSRFAEILRCAQNDRSMALTMTGWGAQDDRGRHDGGKGRRVGCSGGHDGEGLQGVWGKSWGILGKVPAQNGEGVILRPRPSPAILHFMTLWGHFSGEDTPPKNRPSPKHRGTFPTIHPAEKRGQEG